MTRERLVIKSYVNHYAQQKVSEEERVKLAATGVVDSRTRPRRESAVLFFTFFISFTKA